MPALNHPAQQTTTSTDLNENALNTLMLLVATWCRRRLSFLPIQDLPDCIQDVLVRILRQIHDTPTTIMEFVSCPHFKENVMRTVEACRSQVRRAYGRRLYLAVNPSDHLCSRDDGWEERYIEQEDTRHLLTCAGELAKLPEREQQYVILASRSEFTVDEFCGRLGVTRRELARIKHKALKKLRTILSRLRPETVPNERNKAKKTE